MSIDESTISDLLRRATEDVEPSPDLRFRVHTGGRRRLRRRGIGAVVGVVGVLAALVPSAIAVTSGVGHTRLNATGATSPPWPPAQSCDVQSGDRSTAVAYPQLLMLPPDQSVLYAFTNSGGAPIPCGYFPHVALTLLQLNHGNSVRGVEVDGPDAPTVEQFGYAPGGADFNGRKLHLTVGSHSAIALYEPNHTSRVFWSDGTGNQWQVTARGFTPTSLRSLVRDLRFNPTAGTATLPNAASDGWTVEPAPPEQRGSRAGVFYALWHNDGSKLALNVQPGPDRIDQDAVSGGQLTTVQGRPAVVRTLGNNGYEVLDWQVSQNVTVHLAATHSSPTTIMAIANSLRSITANDPRLHRP